MAPLRAAPIVTAGRDSRERERKRRNGEREKARARARSSHTERKKKTEKCFPSCRYVPMRSSLVIYTSAKSYAPRGAAACTRFLYKDASLHRACSGLVSDDTSMKMRHERCVMQCACNYAVSVRGYLVGTVRMFLLKAAQSDNEMDIKL